MGFSLGQKSNFMETKNPDYGANSAEIRIPVELAEADTTFWEEDLDGNLSVKTNSTLAKEFVLFLLFLKF